MSKITVITPSYNQGSYLESTIQSVLNQKFSDLQYIIIDGGSTDNSVEIIKKYEDKLAFWVSEKDNGQTEAINKGLKIATGDIITWLNSDDVLLPNTLTNIARFYSTNPDVDLVHGNTVLHWINGKEIRKKCDEKDLKLKYFAGMPFSQPSAFFTKTILQRVGLLRENLQYGMDYDFFLRIALNGEVRYIDQFFSKYLIHNQSKTYTSSSLFAEEWARIFKVFLRSANCGELFLPIISELGLVSDDLNMPNYNIKKRFSIENIKTILCYHLLNQIIFRYEAGDLSSVKKITTFLKYSYPYFFEDNGLKREYLRSRLLNGKSLLLLRNMGKKIFDII